VLKRTAQATISRFVPLFSEAVRTQHTGSSGGAAYVAVAESAMSGATLATLKEHGFEFYAHEKAKPPERLEAEYVFAAWLFAPRHCVIPPYQTSIEGVCALCLSPNREKALLVWEREAWSMVAGAVEPGESLVAAMSRELMEEVNIELNPDIQPYFMGGYHQARARNNLVNDNFHSFVVVAKEEEFSVDGVEIEKAQWFPWAPILKAWRNANKPTPGRDPKGRRTRGVGPGYPGVEGLDWGEHVPKDKPIVMQSFLRMIDAYDRGEYIMCKMDALSHRCKFGGI